MLENRCCSNGENARVVVIEYLYLDLNTCESSVRTEKVLESIVDELRHAFKIAGYDLEYHKVLIETAEMATAYRFLSSPTIRVNGRDICNYVKENNCGCCEDIDGTSLAEMIAEEIIKWALIPKLPSFLLDEYVLPDDLKKFFDGKRVSKNVYAATKEECEKKLSEMITLIKEKGTC